MAKGLQIPYCTIFLVLGALTCHILVLVGNLQAGAGISAVGDSTGGWSGVGIGIAKSFETEVDHKMNFVAAKLTQTVGTIVEVQGIMEKVIGVVGMVSDIATMQGVSLIAQNASTALQQNQTQFPIEAAIAFARIEVVNMLTPFVNKIFARITTILKMFLDKATPALKQVGAWLVTFGDKLQAGIETFSVTIDKIQKIFDQLMERLSGSGGNPDFMRANTFNLFDTDFSGTISLKDIKKAAEVYGLTALQGTKAEELHRKYDTNQDLELDKDEYFHFVADPSLPKIMSVVLRTYAKILAQIGTVVGRARMRDEVAKSVVGYARLVAQKNRTKVAWVCERLVNGTIPMAFTADVIKNLAVDTLDHSIVTTIDVGQIVVEEMARINHKYLATTVKLLSLPSFFRSEGFDVKDQPKIMGIVARWVVPALKTYGKKGLLLELEQHWTGGSNSTHESLMEEENLHERMAGAAHEHCYNRSLLLFEEERVEAATHHASLRRSPTARLLYTELLGGAVMAPDPAAKAVMKSGVPAVPATLEFAKFLFWNSTRDAQIFSKASFKYSGQSSNPVDAIATQIKGMVKRTQGFLKMLESYATPEGLKKLHKKVLDFAVEGEKELFHVVMTQVNRTLDKVAKRAVNAAAIIPMVIGTLQPLIKEASKMGLVEFPHDEVSNEDLMPSPEHADLIEAFNAEVLYHPEEGPLLHDAAFFEDELPNMPTMSASGAFAIIKESLESFNSVLPTCIDNVKLARKTVNQAQATIHSIFSTFKGQGPPIFYQASKAYDTLWIVYFALLAIVTLGVLRYGFYANNIGADADDDEDVPAEAKEGICETLCNVCCCCFGGGCLDDICFWSVLIVAQIGVLLLFLVAIILCILAGVKNFIASGCSQIYVLGDEAVCTETLKIVQTFMSSFNLDKADFDVHTACAKNQLMTCQQLGPKMATSASLTIIGGLLGAVLSFQMLVDVAKLHVRAKESRKTEKLLRSQKLGVKE